MAFPNPSLRYEFGLIPGTFLVWLQTIRCLSCQGSGQERNILAFCLLTVQLPHRMALNLPGASASTCKHILRKVMELALCSCHIKKYRREAPGSTRLGFQSYGYCVSWLPTGGGRREPIGLVRIGTLVAHSWWVSQSSTV